MCCNGLIVILAMFIGCLAIIYLLYQVYSYIKCGCGKYGPFVSTYGKIKEDMLNEAREVLKKAKKPLKVTDLGCGSGALLIPLAKEFPEHEFIGLEWDAVPLTMGKIKGMGLKNLKFVQGDYMKTSHADMDLIMCYVLKVTGEPLGKKLAEEIKPTCVVISEMFPLGHLDEVKQIQSSIYGVPEKVFVYRKPKAAKPAPKKQPASKKKALAKPADAPKPQPMPKKKAPTKHAGAPKPKPAPKKQPKA